jgi:hypothetical protein
VSSNRAKAQQYRQSDAGRMARKLYNQQPAVKQRKAIKRAIKKHQTPPSISFGLSKPPVGTAH